MSPMDTSGGSKQPEIVTEDKDVEEAIDEVGMGVFHWQVYVIVGLFIAADAVEMGFISFVTEVLKEEWNLSKGERATMESMIFVGMLVGCPTWGWLADRFGRRPIMLLSASLVSLFGFLTAMCQNASQLIPCRLVVGFGCAGNVVAFDVFAELLPTARRGPVTMATFYWYAIGAVYSNVAATYILCPYGWRVFTLVCALPTLVAVIAGACLIPESAHWLVAERRNEEAATVLNGVAMKNRRPMRYRRLTMPPALDGVGAMDLCRRGKLRRPLLWMMCVWLGWGLLYFGIALDLAHVFSKHEAPPRAGSGSEVGRSRNCYGLSFHFASIVITNGGQSLGLSLGVVLINRAGRVKTQVWLYIVAAVFTLGLGFPELARTPLTVFSTIALAATLGASTCTFSHTPELFPPQARVLAMGVCSACTRLGAAAAGYIVSDLIPPLPCACIMSAFALLSAFGASRIKETAGAHIDAQEIDTSDDESSSESGSNEEAAEKSPVSAHALT